MIVALTSKGGRRWRRVKRKEETECERKKEASVSMMVWFPRFGTPYSVSYTVVRPVLCYGQVKTGYLVLYFLTCTVHTLAFCYRTTTSEPKPNSLMGPKWPQQPQRFVQLSRAAIAGASLPFFFSLLRGASALFFFLPLGRPAWRMGCSEKERNSICSEA